MSDRLYELGVLERFAHHPDPAMAILGSPRNWRFSQFWELMSFPSRRERGGSSDVDDFWEMSDVAHLLEEPPADARVVVTEDDPLNSAGDLDALGELARGSS
jgi:hypothetical protein